MTAEQNTILRSPTPLFSREQALEALKAKPEYVGKYLNSRRRQEAAHAEAFPGALDEAFSSDGTIQIEGLTVRPLVASDWALLKKLNSPLYRQTVQSNEMIEAAKAGKLAEFQEQAIDVTEDESYELCFMFTHTPAECRAVLRQGREAFTETASVEFADKVNPVIVGKVIEAISKQVKRAFSTALKYEATNPEGGKKNTSPEQPASGTMG